ncbi:MAG TPA: MotA/TolQ/ExbB proton channel family protein [Bacteroidota bacterium]
MNFLEMFSKGGILMYPILLCSLIAVVIVIERFLVLRKAQIDAGQFMMRLRSVLQKGDIMAGINFCAKTNAPIANLMRRGLTKYPEGHERVSEAIENAGKEEVYHLEKGLGILASIAGVAPLLGFLGTVTGMIGAFQTIQQLSGVVNPSDLAGGIWEALVTTAFGLIIGIPAYAFYNYFVSRVQRSVFEMESVSEEFLDLVRSGRLGDGSETVKMSSGKAEHEEYFQKK